MKSPDDNWHGISIDLWKQVADELELKYEFREMKLADMLQQIESGEVDAAVAALTVTAEREIKMDFGHPYVYEGLGIALRKRIAMREIRNLFSSMLWPMVAMVAGLTLLALLAGIAIWAVEKKKNPEQFGNGIMPGIGNGIWWAIVTMTTVGYGDKSPKTAMGRSIAVAWIFAGLVLVSLFTAAVTTRLTVISLEQEVRDVRDLRNIQVGAVSDSTSEEFLKRNGISRRAFSDANSLLQALAVGDVDAAVYDLTVLRYLIARDYPRQLRVSPRQLEPAQFAFAFPSGSQLREPVNQVLLKRLRSPLWASSVKQYLGN